MHNCTRLQSRLAISSRSQKRSQGAVCVAVRVAGGWASVAGAGFPAIPLHAAKAGKQVVEPDAGKAALAARPDTRGWYQQADPLSGRQDLGIPARRNRQGGIRQQTCTGIHHHCARRGAWCLPRPLHLLPFMTTATACGSVCSCPACTRTSHTRSSSSCCGDRLLPWSVSHC